LSQSWEVKVTAIQEAKKMNEISLEELIGNFHTYELRRSSQVKEATREGRGLALKALKSDDLDLDIEEIAMVTRKPKKFFKKAGGNIRKGSTGKPRNSDHDQCSGCFKCEKPDHIVKSPMQKEELGLEQF